MVIPRPKTDQSNQCHVKVLKSTDHELCPARAFSRWLPLGPCSEQEDAPVFVGNWRKAPVSSLKLAAAYHNVDRKRIINHSMRPGAAALMISACCNVEITKRRVRGLSPNSRTYIWRDDHILSNIGRGMLDTPAHRPGGKRGLSMTAIPAVRNRNQRSVEISKAMSCALRRHQLPGMDEECRDTINVICGMPKLKEMRSTMGDIRSIVNGEDENRKRRLELSPDRRCIRCTQGHSVGRGVRPEILPVATKLKHSRGDPTCR